jgi:hypothetical protein
MKGWLNKLPSHKGVERGCLNGHRRYPGIIALRLIFLSTVQAQENDVFPDNDLSAKMTSANSINNANPPTTTDAGIPSTNNVSLYPDILENISIIQQEPGDSPGFRDSWI